MYLEKQGIKGHTGLHLTRSEANLTCANPGD